MSTLDHVTLLVRDVAKSKVFYGKALEPLGIGIIKDFGRAVGFGRDGKADFWIGEGPASFQSAEQVRIITPSHVAFSARDRAQVDGFHAAALAAGGKDYGAPGLRSHYHPHYYGAFILDLDGHDIEAVFHGKP